MHLEDRCISETGASQGAGAPGGWCVRGLVRPGAGAQSFKHALRGGFTVGCETSAQPETRRNSGNADEPAWLY